MKRIDDVIDPDLKEDALDLKVNEMIDRSELPELQAGFSPRQSMTYMINRALTKRVGEISTEYGVELW